MTSLIESRNWKLEVSKKSPVDVIDTGNPTMKENTEYLMAISDFASEKELKIGSFVYQGLICHNFVSILPWQDNRNFLVGYHGDFFQMNIKDIYRLEFGITTFSEDSIDFSLEVAKKATLGWDNFIINQMEQNAKIKNYAFSVWGMSITEQVKSLKDNVEGRSGLPVTWMLLNCRILSSLEKEESFIPPEIESKYLSGFYGGRWNGADIYCVDNLPRECIGLMGYRGNVYNDASFIVPINKAVSIEKDYICGYGNFVNCLEWTENCLGKLQIC